MEYVYGAMLLHAAGKEINEENLKSVLEAAGVETDEARLKALTASLEGVDIEEILSKAATVPVAAAAPAAEAKAEEKAEAKEEEKEEEKEEVSEEEVAEGLGALFG
ncbi:MAG: 50S ribosomal protein P1 [Thermoplasmata archaeon]|nr:MAG: 50S ribosomal protein P1 [Thermoplasmata archaeon]RLF54135.1 MAG: 50S ribosomal protein P1 [Thermoplasmata archaeon]HDN51235.1 50S ribosomal protein P1 [Thermoplasmatales archaeon]